MKYLCKKVVETAISQKLKVIRALVMFNIHKISFSQTLLIKNDGEFT